jgi:hypothetical protein
MQGGRSVTFEPNSSAEWGAASVAGLNEHADCDLDAIFSNWQFLAAVAWRGYEELGCGVVVVTVSAGCGAVSYVGRTVPASYTRLVERYDPFAELVIVVRHASVEHVYLLRGQPAPPDCAETHCVRSMRTSVYVRGGSLLQ